MSLWAFRFLLFYICILFVQPQNRFTFLYPFHIADISIAIATALHIVSCMQEKRPLIRFGPATVIALLLMAAGLMAQYLGPLQSNTAWNSYIDRLMKAAYVCVLVEAMATSVQRVWAVQMTMLIATLWWLKAGIRLAVSGATYYDDRIMGPAVSIVENPNGFAFMMCVMIPIYLYAYHQAETKWLRWSFLAMALAGVYIVLETGSRTGLIILVTVAAFLVPKYGMERKTVLIVGTAAMFVILSIVSPGNIRRLKTIPKAIKGALIGEAAPPGSLDRDMLSAQERRFKMRDTWSLIKDYPLGVGMAPDDNLVAQKYAYAAGQVHCEILMAGRQMGFVGMGLYAALLATMFIRGRAVQKAFHSAWPEVADIGWTLKMQAVTIAVGGFFSPLPWNPVTLILAASASSLWTAVRATAPEVVTALEPVPAA